ncbi:MAG TPA: DUF3341 domain-containing protein [Opitutaceae bacterium]|nr:DUF3341 domain-containing protein [Opitutaceae bacterium]
MTAPSRIVFEYAAHDDLVGALRRVRAEGYSHVEVYTPFPSDEIDEELPGPPTPVGAVMLLGGVIGGCGAYFMEWYAAHDYPYNSGGRPLNSWPAFIPVTFELTVLCSAIFGLLGLLWLCRLPRLDHPLFSLPQFIRASQDRFFLAIRTDDPRFTPLGLERLLEDSHPLSKQEVTS